MYVCMCDIKLEVRGGTGRVHNEKYDHHTLSICMETLKHINSKSCASVPDLTPSLHL